jgi:phosphoribosylformylglycinamidine (FGAM) synthase-like enzyme
VKHHGEEVCRLDCRKLHEAPRRRLKAEWVSLEPRRPATAPESDTRPEARNDDVVPVLNAQLRRIMADFAIVSREPIIREYDHEVQGNTLLKPLAGASGDAPQDGSVLRIDGSRRLVALACALLPEWGKTDPHLMGRATVDECVRQLVAMGTHPEKIAILDNFCAGNPDDPRELGALVETTKGMARAAEIYGTPFVSGKDSFYNYFKTDEGPVSIPCTLLVSGFGIVERPEDVIGATIRRTGSKLCLVGHSTSGSRGAVFGRHLRAARLDRPPRQYPQEFDEHKAFANYLSYHELVTKGLILSAHDVSEGGLSVALAEMAFGGNVGVRVDLARCPTDMWLGHAMHLFGETPGRIIFEIAPENAPAAEKLGFTVIGETTPDGRLVISDGSKELIDAPLAELKAIWKNGLVQYY